MCLACGEFIPAVKVDGTYEPTYDECPECGARRFKHNQSGQEIHLD